MTCRWKPRRVPLHVSKLVAGACLPAHLLEVELR
jgi:hypothetical protein